MAKRTESPTRLCLILIIASLLSLLFLLSPFSLSSQMSSFSLSLDLNGSEGDQAVQSLDVFPNQVIFIQIFGKDIQNANSFSLRFEYHAIQVVYEGFDTGDVWPNTSALLEQDSGSVEINIASSDGSAMVNSGLIGTLRFRTTDAFSGTQIRLVRAVLGRGEQPEAVTLSVSVALQVAAPSSLDIDGNGFVDFSDFLALAGTFGSNRGDARYEGRLDLDSNGSIEFSDFLEFVGVFGKKVSRPFLPVCDRTAQVRDAIVAAVSVSTCGDVTEVHLAAIDSLRVVGTSLSELQADDFSGLTALTWLNLRGNQLTSLPDRIFDSLTALTWLNLGNNHLSTIPPELGNLSNLTYLHLGRNQLSGEIPVTLGNLNSLTYLSLGGNQLLGEIPAALGGLNSLTYLSLSDNELSGEIPSELGNLSRITSLYLSGNQLRGEIPAALGNLSNLERLGLNNNQLRGEIPSELSRLTNLTGLWLSDNPLRGALPQSLTELTKLKELHFGGGGLCAPLDAAFQAWLQGIANTNGSNCSG